MKERLVNLIAIFFLVTFIDYERFGLPDLNYIIACAVWIVYLISDYMRSRKGKLEQEIVSFYVQKLKIQKKKLSSYLGKTVLTSLLEFIFGVVIVMQLDRMTWGQTAFCMVILCFWILFDSKFINRKYRESF